MTDHGRDERTPLLRRTSETGRNADRIATPDEDFAHLNRQVKIWRRRRWASFVCSGFLILGFVALLILSGVLSRSRGKLHMGSSICLTPSCIHAASEILYNLSPDYQNIDACTDFNHLVCDGFDARHDIAADRSAVSTISSMADNGKTILRHILESPYPNASQHSTFSPLNLLNVAASTDEDNFNMMQETYNSCINETALQKLGVQPLLSLVREVANHFPLGPGNSYGESGKLGENDFPQLSDAILFLQQIGVTTFESLGTGADDKNPEVVIIQASPAGLTLPSPEYYEDADTTQQYQDMLQAVFSAFIPGNSSRDDAAKLAQSVVDLERKIAEATPPPEDQQDVTKYYNIIKVSEARTIAPAIGLDSVIEGLVPSDYNVDSMLLAFPEFLANVSQILTETDKATVQSYLIWKTIDTYADAVQGPEVAPISRFYNVMNGLDPETKAERWQTCVSYVDSTVGWILSRFFIEAAFSADAKNFGDHIVTDIKQQFISKLNALSWMDDSVKKLAINKVNNIDQKIGYPTESPDITNPEDVQAWYAGLEITNSFFNNTVSSNRFSINQSWSELGKPVDHGRWYMQADTVNAYYSPVGNEIVFPAGIMQFPVFQYDLPAYVSYGAFASVAGHELSHAFDSSGRHYDEHGNYTDWWTNHTVKEFTKRADCFVEQYSNFSVPGANGEPLHVNGRLTLGENIADAGGISAAFAAWKQRQQSTPDEDLPGLDYFSHEQLFFIFYSQFWCNKSRKEQLIQRIYTDPHSPAFARILGTMANSRAFREAYNCPVKAPTCELW
ncbi:peptidase family M13 [Pseudomassariella vexata]|uniref:Peptidase family M13 n=1 Tax=Pseudomassariella vexata TaxID=1141098 RepID=A0A1Y2DXR5_9PEZI|nr:peptidase family M13 [Pseudomassariella vexata]ORY64027.1 peptidase family M13 [Pseudomassariella vexata]